MVVGSIPTRRISFCFILHSSRDQLRTGGRPHGGPTRSSSLVFGRRGIDVEEADALWRQLKTANELSLARAVLSRLRGGDALLNRSTISVAVDRVLCQQEAMLTRCSRKSPRQQEPPRDG